MPRTGAHLAGAHLGNVHLCADDPIGSLSGGRFPGKGRFGILGLYGPP
jgi:hypothetical protein